MAIRKISLGYEHCARNDREPGNYGIAMLVKVQLDGADLLDWMMTLIQRRDQPQGALFMMFAGEA